MTKALGIFESIGRLLSVELTKFQRTNSPSEDRQDMDTISSLCGGKGGELAPPKSMHTWKITPLKLEQPTPCSRTSSWSSDGFLRAEGGPERRTWNSWEVQLKGGHTTAIALFLRWLGQRPQRVQCTARGSPASPVLLSQKAKSMCFVGVGKVGLPRPSLREEVGVDVRVRSGRKHACYVCWSMSDSGTKDGRRPQRSVNQTSLWVLIVTWPSPL